jgi:hypothetical protein
MVGRRVAILSVHTHGDRSFLDDRELALASGDLRRAGIESDLVLVQVPDGVEAPPAALIEVLRGYDMLVYERVPSRPLMVALRAALPSQVLVACQGEHRLLAPPADYECRGELRRAVVALVQWLRGERAAAPPGTRRRVGDAFEAVEPAERLSEEALPYAPNLRPVIVGEAPAGLGTFSILGNAGCPYQADARENPVYAGVRMPEDMGRGCAFCTTGNRYEHRAVEATAASVLEQLRYVRREAPERDRLVLKDQSPFAWLPEVVERIGAEGLGPLTLLLETRVDWMVRNAMRFERALERAVDARVRLAPYLIGIESFSQAELDRFNKGMKAEDNIAFLESVDRWEAQWPESLDLSQASFGFVLFTPWTTMEDLAINHAAMVRTGLDRFRGSVLLSRARLYPDTALYWLAKRDGLLADTWEHEGEDNARRYGYFPGHPWRFRDARVARFSALSIELSEAMGSRDQRRLFGALLEVFARDERPTAEKVIAAMAGQPPLPTEHELRARLSALVRLPSSFASGWRVAELRARPNRLRVTLRRAEEAVTLDLVPRSEEPAFARSRHYDVRYLGRELAGEARGAVEAFCRALVAGDR